MLFALIFMELPTSSILDAQAAADGTPVRMKGTVEQVQQRGNMTIITISQPSTIEITVFEEVNITSQCVVIQGKKGSYKGASQVTASRVERCKN
jgi:hypothetical protein